MNLKKLKNLWLRIKKTPSGLEYWQMRAKKYGKYSVLNIAHSKVEFDEVTAKQKREIYPYFTACLKGNEKTILDFGCGPGRFTSDLASMTGGQAIGIDPISELLGMAPKADKVEYKTLEGGKIPLPDLSVDVVWVCLVFGGIEQEAVKQSAGEIRRVLKNNGLLFLVENTSEKENSKHWVFRQLSGYQEIFSFVLLEDLHDYLDLGERISVMAGRKYAEKT